MIDQNFLFMAFLMLCFAGLATMFYFLMRNIDELTRTIKEDRNQTLTNMRALESSLNRLGDLVSAAETPASSGPQSRPRLSSALTGGSARPAAANPLPDRLIPDLSGRTLGYSSSLPDASGFPDLPYAAAEPDVVPVSVNSAKPSAGVSSLPDLSLAGPAGAGRR